MPRIAIVRKEDCHPQSCGNFLCARLCPVNRAGADCITPHPTTKKALIDEELCTGCGICPNRCPFKAIDIINLPEDLCKQPLHQYGRNGFHLYNIPIPQFGKVVGIVGKNGIGKSTALMILSGKLQPNLGDWTSDGSQEDLIQFFKGTEAQTYFEKIKDQKIIVSVKPQQVELIPRHIKGKVVDILRKVDEKGRALEYAEELGITAILDNDITKLSGGELQRVAIAAAALKKANVYFFDEPTSYLDTKQRIHASNFIRKLTNEETAVLVIEHDLVVLDYMTDIIHVMYGKETAYGIVSQPKASRVGINVYLDGFLKEENMRFRDHAIKFERNIEHKNQHRAKLTSWENITKVLGKFHLSAPAGTFYRSNVIGMLGENGIGKTSFVKLLANVVKPDTGGITKEIKVSYKPQYLDTESKELVMSLLHDAVKKYTNEIIHPLAVDKLLQKPLNELSGGELQRVTIALCLSKEADLYLLDEPSAYLDVEQRLIVSRVIRDIMEHRTTTALVVDHDLMFIDYIADNVIVVDGQPAVNGVVHEADEVELGMNAFLQLLQITMRRDIESHRPRVNKPDSVKDREQRSSGKWYGST